MVTPVLWTFLSSPSCNLRLNSHPSDPLLKADILLPSRLMTFPCSSFPCKPEVVSFCLNSSETFWKLNPTLLEYHLWKSHLGSLGAIAPGAKTWHLKSGSRFCLSSRHLIVGHLELCVRELSGYPLGASFIIDPVFGVSSYISYKLKLRFPLLSISLSSPSRGLPHVSRCGIIHFSLPSVLCIMASSAWDPNMPFPNLTNLHGSPHGPENEVKTWHLSAS